MNTTTFDRSRVFKSRPLVFLNAPAGYRFTESFDAGALSITVTAVPEPATGILAAAGLGVLLFAGQVQRSGIWRRRHLGVSPATWQLAAGRFVAGAAIFFRYSARTIARLFLWTSPVITSIALATLLLTSMASVARGEVITVDARANIFGAGHAAPPAPDGGGGGLLPPSLDVSFSAGAYVTVSGVTGSVRAFPSFAFHDAEGNGLLPTNATSFGGISGLLNSGASDFLVGVFVGGTEPFDPAPTRLDFSPGALGTSFSTLAPALNQQFFIGDGLTGSGSGSVQQFLVPAGATKLYFGFDDSQNSPAPGWYDDNQGSLTLTATLVPEPATWVLAAVGILCALGRRRVL